MAVTSEVVQGSNGFSPFAAVLAPHSTTFERPSEMGGNSSLLWTERMGKYHMSTTSTCDKSKTDSTILTSLLRINLINLI